MPQDPLAGLDPLGMLARRQAVRASLDRAQQPSDDNVWKARIMGGLAGSGKVLYDLLGGSGDDVVDPTIGLAPAATIGQKGLKTVANEAYQAVRGIPGLYSRLTDAATKLPKMLPTAEVNAALRGLQAPLEEINYRKLPEMLQQVGPKVSRDQILEHLDQNPIELERHLYTAGGTPEPHWESVQSHPATNYHESIITLPQEQSAETLKLRELRDNILGQLEDAKYHGNSELAGSLERRYNELVKEADRRPDPFTGGHWSEFKDVLGWSRSNQMDLPDMGGQGRLAQTIQSDWHQGGAARGYNDVEAAAKVQALKAKLDELVRNSPGSRHPDAYEAPDPVWQAKTRQMEQTLKEVQKYGAVPEAPFKENWPGLMIKQDLLDLADNPDINWYGMVDAPTQARRWGIGHTPMFDSLVSKQSSQLSKALKPYGGGTLESFPAGSDLKTNYAKKPVGAVGTRLSPTTKELIRKYGFPAFSALAGLKMATSHGEEQ